MRFDSAVAIGVTLASLAAPARAQEISTVPEHLLGMVGEWRLEQEDQSLPTCALTFTEDQSIGGWQIQLHEPCPPPFPPAESFVAWNVDESDGSVLITDGLRNDVLRLIEAEDGLYMTEPGVVPAFYLMLPYDEDGMGGEMGDEMGAEIAGLVGSREIERRIREPPDRAIGDDGDDVLLRALAGHAVLLGQALDGRVFLVLC